MAYTSFRVRRQDNIAAPDANPFGSYVRGTDETVPAGLARVDADSALRASGFVVSSASTDVYNATFSAIAVDYSIIDLSWSSFLLVNPAENSVGETNIFEVVIVYSSTGFPETVADGVIVKTQTYSDETSAVTHEDFPQGRWAYYSLFLHWNQNGTGPSGVNWYERVASLQELVPKNYGGTTRLWNRLPNYIKSGDTSGRSLDPTGQGRGQLERFINVFGFELDRTQTLINSVITQYDPSLTESESLDQLSKMLGLEIDIQDIGLSRIRQIIQDIGYYRQRKGTIDAAAQYITAISGSQVDVIESITDPRYTFRVYAEKANLVADSLFVIESGTKKWALSVGNDLTRTNLLPNPNMDNASVATYYQALKITETRSTDYAYSGTYSLKGVIDDGTAAQYFQVLQTAGAMIDVVAGQTYTFSAYIYLPASNTADTNWRAELYFWNGTTYTSPFQGTTTTITRGNWTRLTVTATVPAGYYKALPRIYAASTLAVGQVAYVDAWLLETGSILLPYFDGTYNDPYSGYTLDTKSWTGTANASTSISVWDSQLSYIKTNEFITITNSGSASAQFSLTSLVAVPVDADTDYWSSIEMTGTASVYGSQWSASAGWTEWTTEDQYDRVMPASLSPAGRSVILMPDITTTTTAYPVMQFAIPAGGWATVSKWMVEPKTYGTFFNGSSDFGGFIYQDNFADHAWSDQEYASYSIYTTNKKKTQDAITKLLPTLIPVTILIQGLQGYALEFDWIPGKT